MVYQGTVLIAPRRTANASASERATAQRSGDRRNGRGFEVGKRLLLMDEDEEV
jgi:hypothetical protein